MLHWIAIHFLFHYLPVNISAVCCSFSISRALNTAEAACSRQKTTTFNSELHTSRCYLSNSCTYTITNFTINMVSRWTTKCMKITEINEKLTLTLKTDEIQKTLTYIHIGCIGMCGAKRCFFFQPFCFEIGCQFGPFWSEKGYGLFLLVLNWVCCFRRISYFFIIWR